MKHNSRQMSMTTQANKHLSLTPTIHRLPSGTHVQVVSYRLTR